MFLDTVRGKNGGVEFWQIAVDKANSEEYFDDRSLVVYLQALFGKLYIIHQICKNFHYPKFPTYISANTVRMVGDLARLTNI